MHVAESELSHRIWVVDDDDLFRGSIAHNLIDRGYDVETFSDGPAMIDYMANEPPADLLLLDWKMPHMNGIEVLHHVRESGIEVPVIFLTVLSEQIYEEAALLGGAVDFIEKSRSFAIVQRRIELILEGRRADSGDGLEEVGEFTVGRLHLDTESRRAYWKDIAVELTHSEFGMVHLLASRANRDIAYREIYDVARGPGFLSGQGDDGYRANVRSSIKRIRQKFRDIDPDFDWIENYPGFGYRWRTPQ